MRYLKRLLILVAVLCASFAFSLVSASAAEELEVYQFGDLIKAVHRAGDVDIILKYDIVFVNST